MRFNFGDAVMFTVIGKICDYVYNPIVTFNLPRWKGALPTAFVPHFLRAPLVFCGIPPMSAFRFRAISTLTNFSAPQIFIKDRVSLCSSQQCRLAKSAALFITKSAPAPIS